MELEFARAEALRAAHEELARLVDALAERRARFPWLFEGRLGSSQRLTAMQRLEASRLIARYGVVYDKLKAGEVYPSDSRDVQHKYVRHTDRRGLEKFRCDFTEDLDVDKVYTFNEHYGRFLDLRPLYTLYRQRQPRDLSYEAFLESFPQTHDLEYLQQVAAYLEDAFSRFRPFERHPEVKELNLSDPLWCNACNKHFTTPGVFQGHLQGRKHKRNAKLPNSLAKVLAYTEALQPFLEDTKADARRRKQMTERELEAERENLRLANLREDGDAQVVAHTSKQHQPLGPDGKPIPRWLWKLNGMNHEYECEVCGGHVYNGRRQFDRHFEGVRHANGLKLLGLSYSNVLNGITSIDEARQLSRRKVAKPDVEIEDDEGNVYEERTYNDLKRQGLL